MRDCLCQFVNPETVSFIECLVVLRPQALREDIEYIKLKLSWYAALLKLKDEKITHLGFFADFGGSEL